MVTLAPELRTQGDPEYLRYSKPISGIEGNKAGYYLTKGVGEAVASGIDTADKIVANYTEQKAYEEGQKAEEAKKAEIEPIWRQLTGQESSTNQSGQPQLMSFQPTETDGSGSLIQNNKDLPPEIRFGTKQAASLNEKFVNGKLSQTQYDMEVDSLAKDLNSRFPAYHNEIARGLSRATGRANANQTASDMIQDINRIMSKANEEKNKIQTKILGAIGKTDPETFKQLYQDWSTGKKSDIEALGAVSKWEYEDTKNNRLKTQYELSEAQRKNTKESATQDYNQVLSGIETNIMHDFQVRSGAGSGDELIAKLQNLTQNPNDPEALKTANDLRTLIQTAKLNMQRQAATYSRTLGTDTHKMIEERMAFWDHIASELGDPAKAGNAVSAAQSYVATQESNATLGIVKSSAGQAILKYNALTKLSPELAKEYQGQIMQHFKDFGPKLGELFKDTRESGMALPPTDPRHPVIANRIEQAQAMGAGAKTIRDYINDVQKIADVNDPELAKNYAYTYFDPRNLGMVSKWARDTFVGGKMSEGQVHVLQTLGSKPVIDRIYALGDPQLIKYTKNFMENAFAHTVFPSMLMDTRDMTLGAGDRLRYNDKTAHFELDPKGTGGTSTFIRNTIQRLNFSIDTMKNIAQHEGKDPNEYLISLIRAGDPEAFTREITGFPKAINDAIKQQALQREFEKQQEKKNLQRAKELSK